MESKILEKVEIWKICHIWQPRNPFGSDVMNLLGKRIKQYAHIISTKSKQYLQD